MYCSITVPCYNRRRVNMVGVNMVLAEYVKFKHGLHKSCGIECFEGIKLEPCHLDCVLLCPGGAVQKKPFQKLKPLDSVSREAT